MFNKLLGGNMKNLFLAVLGILMLAGCASMKSNLDPGIKKIAIPVVTNGTSQYGIDTEMTDFIQGEFRK